MREDKDLKSALDDIFGSDFIEIDVDKTSDNNVSENKENVIFKDSEENNNFSTEPWPINLENESIFDDDVSQMKDETPEIKTHSDYDIPAQATNKPNEIIKEESYNKHSFKETKTKDNFNKKIILYVAIGFIVGFLLIFVLTNYVFGIDRVVNCSTSAKDTGYKYSDEYKITYKKNKINYVEGIYTYNALNDEYKAQIEIIKEDKKRAIINSNGMSGFTYTYETSDDYFKVNSYLDFTLFNYDEIKKIDQDLMPLSYFKINEDMTFESLKKHLEKEGYVCISSK